MEKGDVVLIDGYNLMYRAFHGTKNTFQTSYGLPTSAIYTTMNMLKKIPTQFDIQYGLVVFDGKGSTFRDELDSEYKANRSPMPEDLKLQIEPLKEGIGVLGWPLITADGVEADDIIGTLAVRAASKGFNVYIVSGDKDFRALVDDRIKIVDTMYNIIYDREQVFEKMGVYPENVTGYLAMLGDSSDNVGGIDKVGKKTAAKLLNEFGSIDGVIKNVDSIKGIVGQNLKIAIENGALEKALSLIQLKTNVEVPITTKSVSLKEIEEDKFVEFCKKYEFASWLNKAKKNSP